MGKSFVTAEIQDRIVRE